MGKWDLQTVMTGLRYNDRFLASDQSEADGTQDRNITASELAAGFEREVAETGHGLAVGDAVRYNGTAYVEATADTSANAELLGVVTTVIDTDTFAYKSWGQVVTSGLTAGDLYYLQDAGGLGATAGTVEVPIGVATSTTELWLLPIGQGGGGGGSSTESFVVAVSDETTALTTGTEAVTFRMPYAFTLSDVRASVATAPTGSTITVDINEGGTTILSTKLTIDATEKTSTTAATAAVISDTALADDAEITIDVDAVGSSTAGAGLKVTLIGTQA